MKRASLTMALALLMAQAQAEPATTLKAVELKNEPFADAETVARVAEKSAVDIVKRQGAWTQVKFGTQQGWVKLLSLRLGGSTGEARKEGDSGLGSLLSAARTGSSGVTSATGVRGLDEEDLKNPKPNPQEFEKLKALAVNDADAKAFAAQGKLSSHDLEYLKTEGAQ